MYKAGKQHYHLSSATALYPYTEVFLLLGLLKHKIQSTSKAGLTPQSLTYRSRCVCPEPDADRLNLGLQTGDSTIWRSSGGGPVCSEKEGLKALLKRKSDHIWHIVRYTICLHAEGNLQQNPKGRKTLVWQRNEGNVLMADFQIRQKQREPASTCSCTSGYLNRKYKSLKTTPKKRQGLEEACNPWPHAAPS